MDWWDNAIVFSSGRALFDGMEMSLGMFSFHKIFTFTWLWKVKTKLSVGNVINIPYGFLIFIIKKQFQNHIKYQFNGMYRDNVHSSTNYTPQETETKSPHKRGGQPLAGCSSNQLCGMLEFRIKPCFGNNTAKNQCLQLVRFDYNFNIFCTWAY